MAKYLGRIAVAAAVAIFAGDARATNGYFSHGYGIESKSEGGAGIALGRDALTIATNPAALVEVHDGLELGFDAFAPRRGATIVQGGEATRYDGNDKKTFWIPEIGYSRHLNSRLVVGIAIFGNGGLNTDYGQNPFARFGATGRAGVDLSQAFVSPAIAYRITDSQSLGVAVNFAYQRFKAEGIGIFAGFSEDPAHVSNQGYDDSSGWGVRVGWNAHLSNKISVGASWQSKTKTSRFKKYSGLFADQGGFDIPETYGVGIAVRPNAAFSVAVDWQRILYADVPSVGNPIDSLFAGVPLGASNGPGFGWRNVSVVKAGASWRVNDRWSLRAGVSHADQPIASSQTFFNILAPGTVETHATLGVTWRLRSTDDISVSFLHAFEHTVRGNGSIPAAFGGGEVDVDLKEDSLGFAWRHRFGSD